MHPSGKDLRTGVREAYSAAAIHPEQRHPFPAGRAFAEAVGYPARLLDSLPGAAAEVFAGVSNVSLFAQIRPGATVLDLGCGGGLDTLIAARRAGPEGLTAGLDFSRPMVERARRAAAQADDPILICQGNAEALPFAAAAFDVSLVNGIFNLNPARESIFSELARVIRPGGEVYAAELIVLDPLPSEQKNETNWFA